MADLRGIPTSEYLAMGRLTPAPGQQPPAGFTSGSRYWPLALAVDCAPVPPVAYVITVNDAGQIVAAAANAFHFQLDALTP